MNPFSIEWEKLVHNLQRRGLGLAQVANQLQVPASALQPVWLGQDPEPPFSVGLLLLDLHLDVCPDHHPSILGD